MKKITVLLLTIASFVAMSVVYAADGQDNGRRYRDEDRGGNQVGHQGGNYGGERQRGNYRGEHQAGNYRGGHRDRHYGGYYPRHDGHRHHNSSSFVFSYGYYGYPFPYYPYNYPGQVVIEQPAAPAIYVEKSDEAGPYYWYYCTDPRGYYPYVDRCLTDWMQVVPQAPQR